MGIPDAQTAEAETIALGQLARFSTEDLKRCLKTLARYRALVPPQWAPGAATDSRASKQQNSSGPSKASSNKGSPSGRAAPQATVDTIKLFENISKFFLWNANALVGNIENHAVAVYAKLFWGRLLLFC